MSDNTTSTWQEMLNQRTPGTWYATDEGDSGSDLIIDESGKSLLTSGALADGWAGFEHVPDAKLAALGPSAVALSLKLLDSISELNSELAAEYARLDEAGNQPGALQELGYVLDKLDRMLDHGESSSALDAGATGTHLERERRIVPIDRSGGNYVIETYTRRVTDWSLESTRRP